MKSASERKDYRLERHREQLHDQSIAHSRALKEVKSTYLKPFEELSAIIHEAQMKLKII